MLDNINIVRYVHCISVKLVGATGRDTIYRVYNAPAAVDKKDIAVDFDNKLSPEGCAYVAQQIAAF